jgi:hypothetical protein
MWQLGYYGVVWALFGQVFVLRLFNAFILY